MAKRLKYLLLVFFSSGILLSCDDIITVSSTNSTYVLNIDAWLNNRPEVQTISLTMSQDYLANDALPPGVSGASVTVVDSDGNTFDFEEDLQSKDGSYRWTPPSGEVFGIIGKSYSLYVTRNDEVFTSTCKMGRVPPVDSITFAMNDNIFGGDEKNYTAQFWGTDPAGVGDTYWIKTYKNGVLLNKPVEINLAYDAAPEKSDQFDGLEFTVQVRSLINSQDDDSSGNRLKPLVSGDSIYVEINSLTEVSYNYLEQVVIQTDRNGGVAELFSSTPLANVGSNIVNQNSNGSSVVGFFNVSAVSGRGRKFMQ